MEGRRKPGKVAECQNLKNAFRRVEFWHMRPGLSAERSTSVTYKGMVNTMLLFGFGAFWIGRTHWRGPNFSFIYFLVEYIKILPRIVLDASK
jgi:hypothetical protein